MLVEKNYIVLFHLSKAFKTIKLPLQLIILKTKKYKPPRHQIIESQENSIVEEVVIV